MPRVRMPPGTTPQQLESSLNNIAVGTPIGAFRPGDSPLALTKTGEKIVEGLSSRFYPYWAQNPNTHVGAGKELRSIVRQALTKGALATVGPEPTQEEASMAPAPVAAQPTSRLDHYKQLLMRHQAGTLSPEETAAFGRLQAAGRFKDLDAQLNAPPVTTPAPQAGAGGSSLLDAITPPSPPATPGTPTTQATAPDAGATSTTPVTSTTTSSLDPMARRTPRPEDFGDAPGTVPPGSATAGPAGTQRKPSQLAGRGFRESLDARLGGSLKEHALNALELPGSMSSPEKMTRGVGSALTLLGTPGAVAGAGAEKLSGSRTAGDVAQLGVDYGPAVVGAARLLPGGLRMAGRMVGRGAAGEYVARKLARSSQRVRDVLPELARGGERVVTESLETARRATPPRLLHRADILAATPQPTYNVGGGTRLPVRNLRTLSNRSFVPGNPEGPITMADQLITPELSAIRNAAGRHADALDNLTTMMGELTGHPREQAQLAREAVDRIHTDIPDLARRFPGETKAVEKALRSMERQIGTRRKVGQYETLAYTIGQLLSAAQRGGIGEPVRRDTAFNR